jgi:hypothetical protein
MHSIKCTRVSLHFGRSRGPKVSLAILGIWVNSSSSSLLIHPSKVKTYIINDKIESNILGDLLGAKGLVQ